MVLAGRAAVYSSLQEHGLCALCDLDESEAYLRVVREATHQLLRCLPHVWDYSGWARRYYGRLVIKVITREGFAPPFSSGEGGNQGDAFAALHYQAPIHVLTLSLGIDWAVALPLRLPGLSVALPATVLVYSDDRRFISPTLQGAVALADSTRDASRREGRIIHPDKLEYFQVWLLQHDIQLERCPVPNSEMYTSMTPPELVGVPLLPELPLLRAANKSLRAIRSVHKATERGPAAPALRLRSLHAFGLSVLDYVASGVLFSSGDLRPHQRATDGVYLAAFRLPPWTHRALLRLPLTSGGFGSPDVTLRAHLQLLNTYLRASWSTNLLAVAASHYLLSLPWRALWQPEGLRLREALQPLGVHLHTLPSTTLSGVTFYSTRGLDLLSTMQFVIAATDGSQAGSHLGAGVLLWHPAVGAFYRMWFGVQTCAGHSTDAEWLAKIALLFALGDWPGDVLLVTDSTAALMSNLTRAPPASFALVIPFRASVVRLRARLY